MADGTASHRSMPTPTSKVCHEEKSFMNAQPATRQNESEKRQAKRVLNGHVDGFLEWRLRGWAFEATSPQRKVEVFFFIDGQAAGGCIANAFRPDLKELGYGDGAHGFSFEIPLYFMDGNAHRVDAIDLVTRLPLPNSPQTVELPSLSTNGAACFVSERHIGGWLTGACNDDRTRIVQLLEDGSVVTEAAAELPSPVGPTGAYRLELPEEYLDGTAHNFVIRLKDTGSVVAHFACVTPCLGATRARRAFFEEADWAKDLPGRLLKGTDGLPASISAEAQARGEMEGRLQGLPEDEVEERYRLIVEIAGSLRRDGQIDEAANRYRAAIALDGEKAEAHVALARMLAFSGRESESDEVVAQVQQILSEDAEVIALQRQLAARRRAKKADMIAFYLPQFHITPENNEWWGRGFTEWTNVGKARPLFDGHLQPRRPTALGYYDLRLAEAANAQFEMARNYGIAAFCYYYYWFDGRMVLDRPLQDLLEGRTGPFPFCICWANEDWTRSWDGLSGEVLLAQNHSPESDRRFMEELIPVLQHPEYYRYEGKPLVLIYRINKLAEPKETVEEWRQMCRDAGLGEIYLCAVQSFGLDDPREFGCDAAVEFPPHCSHWKYPQLSFHSEVADLPNLVDGFSGNVYDYQSFAKAAVDRPAEAYPLHRACFLAWDNTARRDKSAHVFHHYSVEAYRRWLATVAAQDAEEHENGLVFINAWNEWAEGATLEPDNFFGFENLEATRNVQRMIPYVASRTYWVKGEPQFPADRLELDHRVILVGHDAHLNGAQINLLNMARCFKRELGVKVVIVLLDGGPLLPKYEQLGRTVVLGKEEGWERALVDLAEHYAKLGTQKAICNTAVTGDAVAILREAGYKVVSLVHELPSVIETYRLQPQCWRIADRSDYIVFASRIVRDHFTERFWPSSSKTVVAPQGIVRNPHHSRREQMRAEIRAECEFPEDALIVMGCGFGDTRKGIDLFVQMAAEVRRLSTEQPVRFIWVGDLEGGIGPYVRADIRRLGLEDELVITGYTEEPSRFYIAADVFALTSREDPFPSVVMEAFEAGVPVVAFDGGGGYVDIVDARTGGLVPYLDVGAMARKVHALLSNKNALNEIGRHCHEFCRENFSYGPYLRKLLALLDGVPPEDVVRGILKHRAWLGDAPTPRISVIVPNFNYGRHLELRLRTILDQTLAPYEIIVLDDASTDYSLSVIEAVAQTAKIPIRLVRNEENTGNPFVQWARGLEMARGDLVWIAEADDYCEPVLLERLARELTDEKVVMAWCDSVVVDDEGTSHGFQYKTYHASLHDDRWHNSFTTSGKLLNEEILLHNNVVPNASAVLFRRTAVPPDLEIQQYKFSGDWWFWIELAETGDVTYVAAPLNYHRRHSQSVMGGVLGKGDRLLSETMSFFQRLIRRRPSRISDGVAANILDRLDNLYRGCPDLVGTAGAIYEHPHLGTQYRELIAELNSFKAAARVSQRQAAVLLVSADALENKAAAAKLLETLRRTHELHLVLLGGEEDAEFAAIETPGQYESVTWILPDTGRHRGLVRADLVKVGECTSKRVAEGDLAREVHSILMEQPPQSLYASGFLALGVVAEIGPIGGVSWQIVAGPEFDRLLGNPPPSSCTLPELRRAMGSASALLHLEGKVPQAAGQLARDQKVVMKPFQWAQMRVQAKRPDQPVRLVGIAPSAPLETWRDVATVLASQQPPGRLVLRLLAWGQYLEQMRQEFEGEALLEVVAIYDLNADFASLGEVAIDVAEDRLHNTGRTWPLFVRAGMKTVARVCGTLKEEYQIRGADSVVEVQYIHEIADAAQMCIGKSEEGDRYCTLLI